MAAVDPIVVLIARGAIVALFVFSCGAKLRAFPVFRHTLAEYHLLPTPLVSPVAVAVVLLEGGIVAATLGGGAAIAMSMAAALLVLYAVAIGINLVRGRRDIDCGCTGPASRQLISAWLVVRNLTLAAVAVIGAMAAAPRATGIADLLLAAAALVGLIVLYAALNQLMANAPRLDALDDMMDTA